MLVYLHRHQESDDCLARAGVLFECRSVVEDRSGCRQGLKEQLDPSFSVGVDSPPQADAFGRIKLGFVVEELWKNEFD